MYGYIYKTTDTETNLIYVGQKKSTVFLGNRYVGSGTTIRAIQHNTDFHPDRFDVQLLDTADSSDELNQKEIFWIQKLDAQNPKVGYNRCKGGAQISQGKKGKIKIIHTASGKIKYINKNDLPQFASCGYVPSRNYSR